MKKLIAIMVVGMLVVAVLGCSSNQEGVAIQSTTEDTITEDEMDAAIADAVAEALAEAESETSVEPSTEAATDATTDATTDGTTGESTSTQNTDNYITETEAQEIAIAHAGLKESEVSRVKVQFDYDDGRAEYEVEFYVGTMEYDYDIDAETGEIISYDKDYN